MRLVSPAASVVAPKLVLVRLIAGAANARVSFVRIAKSRKPEDCHSAQRSRSPPNCVKYVAPTAE